MRDVHTIESISATITVLIDEKIAQDRGCLKGYIVGSLQECFPGEKQHMKQVFVLYTYLSIYFLCTSSFLPDLPIPDHSSKPFAASQYVVVTFFSVPASGEILSLELFPHCCLLAQSFTGVYVDFHYVPVSKLGPGLLLLFYLVIESHWPTLNILMKFQVQQVLLCPFDLTLYGVIVPVLDAPGTIVLNDQ